ncbi:polysaccharide pyruvyl transferase family protein [Paenibacillus daejeonensis]|uniref:polysaccharide pyruvyl transferase family protein n=1 Tax=Paenibacillus daejeonensis TaxID=135193 RepID=UPI000365E2DD|nr:polysaccharide pyruvyl transferase family protein [Paenibacillus daejeonensis]
MKKILYIGWVGYRNLGDELMLDLFKQRLLASGGEYQLEVQNNEPGYMQDASIEPYDCVVLGGGSILSGLMQVIDPVVINFLKQTIHLNKKLVIWGSGIDWLPHSSIAALQRQEPVALDIPESLVTTLREVFAHSVWAGVRGPYTQAILTQLGVHNVQVSGDPGFLMTRTRDTGNETSERIIGVNWGTALNRIYGGDELRVEDQLAEALCRFASEGYAIYLYTMWNQDQTAINRLYHKISPNDKVIMDKKIYHQDDLISLIQSFDFTINLKLHANYLSVAAEVPFIALGYRFKVFDFAHSIGMEDYVISTNDPNLKDRMLETAGQISAVRPHLVSLISHERQRYAGLIHAPFTLQLF